MHTTLTHVLPSSIGYIAALAVSSYRPYRVSRSPNAQDPKGETTLAAAVWQQIVNECRDNAMVFLTASGLSFIAILYFAQIYSASHHRQLVFLFLGLVIGLLVSNAYQVIAGRSRNFEVTYVPLVVMCAQSVSIAFHAACNKMARRSKKIVSKDMQDDEELQEW